MANTGPKDPTSCSARSRSARICIHWARFQYPLGTFPAGDYTVTAELAYRDFFGVPSVLTIGVASFTVAGAPSADPAPVPTLSVIGMVALLTLVLVLSFRKLRARKIDLLALALACMPFGVQT